MNPNNPTVEVLLNHTSIRKFTQEEISDEAVKIIVESAKRGATAGNMMLYSMVKIRSKSTLKSLSESCDDQPFIANAPLALLFVLDHNKWQKYFEISGLPNRIEGFSGPSVSDFVLAMQDATIAAQNAVIAAESMGIGTCYIGDIMEHYETHKALFNLPEYTMPAILVVFGHYEHKPVLKPRFEDEFTVFDEAYPDIDEAFIQKMFQSRDESTEDFAYKFYMRKKNADFFKEMNRSIHKYLSEWTENEKRTD
ncbi:nitroreductase family protein [Fusibacter sp. 3D3]|uniref:nitroreductase family protein n=1 Tax=Fusibacter sp. 3D3 TaxID=1048380 RepID=UPI000852F652|nr:nitroreductase family protein [Fusibacter sp. 3D3]GAU78268.1 oxygen-insensitive NADPH nitroreductase [Fusibacter sp. 3D3]